VVAGRFSLGSSRRLTLQWGLRAAARVSFTVETTVLPSFALPRGSCKWEGFVLVLCVFQPRMARIFTNGKRLCRRFSLLILFVFIRDIRGSRTSGQDGARVVAGTRRRGGRAVQSWVKPEVDPPMGVARCRASFFHGRDDRAPLFCAARGACKWEASSSYCAFFNHELIEFSRMGSGFAGDSPCWFYSCLFGIFVVQGHPGRMGRKAPLKT
jgi:hypothetical protein